MSCGPEAQSAVHQNGDYGRPRKKILGELSHADFGKVVEGLPGHGPGVLWSITHTAAVGDTPEPWTQVIIRPTRGGGSEGTRALPSTTVVRLRETPADTSAGVPSEKTDVHKPYDDDGVTYCGWSANGHTYNGCGEFWPCATVRAGEP